MKSNKIIGIHTLLSALSLLLLISATGPSVGKYEIILSPASGLMTKTIGAAIDKCAANGGGTVRFMRGTYLSGTIELQPNVKLLLDSGVILRGSDKYSDYRNDAFIYGKDLKNIAIIGEGTIDGVDCANPKGEEGFRGPHCIRLVNCDGIVLKGITIVRSANWAVNCRYCKNGKVENVKIRGGHDGLHTRFCSDFTVKNCDFRTGDDAFAGNDNQNFVVTDCLINTSCNGFRFGCHNFRLERCRFWGPGEYAHKIQKRNNMLSAFVHFSPKDEKAALKSGNWTVKDVTVENVDFFYNYNFEKGLWQTGQPVTSLSFENIRATGLLCAFSIVGSSDRLLNMAIKNSSFNFRENFTMPAQFEGANIASGSFIGIKNFSALNLNNVEVQKQDTIPLLHAINGNSISLKKTTFVNSTKTIPYIFENVERIEK
jgi:hypothetical protein